MYVAQTILPLGDFEVNIIEELKETEKAYLAGLIDGEGCILINKTGNYQYILRVSVMICDQDLTEYWHNRTGLGSLGNGRKYSKEHPNWRPTYQWVVLSDEAYDLLKDIYPYLLLKRDQADIAFQFQELIRENRGGRKRGTPHEIFHQLERYKLSLSRLKNHVRAHNEEG